MPQFELEISESVATRKRIVVEADSADEAIQMALIGNTVSEEELKQGEVIDRTLLTTAKAL